MGHHGVDQRDVGLEGAVGCVGEQADQSAEVVGQDRADRGRVAEPQRDEGRAEGVVQVLDLGRHADPAGRGGHGVVAVREDQRVDGAEPGGDDVLGTLRVLRPHREERRADHPVARSRTQPEGDRGDAAGLDVHLGVEQQAQVATVVALAAAAVPDPDGQGEPLEHDGVVGLTLAVPLQPHRQPVARVLLEGRVHLRSYAVRVVPAGVDAHRPGGGLGPEAGDAAGERGGRREERAGVDVADHELVEAGDDAQAEARARVETRDAAEQLLHDDLLLVGERSPVVSRR